MAATLLPVPLLWTLPPSTSTKTTLLLAYTFATFAIATASLRTYLVHSTRLTHGPPTTFLTSLASSIQLSTGLTAALLPSLPSLFPSPHRPSSSSFSQITNYVPHFTTKPRLSTTNTASLSTHALAPRYHSFRSNSSRYTYGSTSTVLRHGHGAWKRPSSGIVPLRYHDNESNVEFELLTPTRARSRTTTLRSYPQSVRSHPQSLRSYPQSLNEVPVPQLDLGLHQQLHQQLQLQQSQQQQRNQRQSRTASVWNEKEGLFVAAPRHSPALGVEDLEDGTSAIRGEGGREAGREREIGRALTTAPRLARLCLRSTERGTEGEVLGPVEGGGEGIGEGAGEEMAELRRLFEDGDVQWGVLEGSPEEREGRLGRYRGVRI